MNSEELLVEIAKKLDILIRLRAYEITSKIDAAGGQKKDKIEALASAGMDARAIAESVGTTLNTVRVRLSEAKKKEPS